MQENDKYINLIFKELTNEILTEESFELRHWIQSDSKNSEIYESYKKTWTLTEKEEFLPEIEAIDVDFEWNKFIDKSDFNSPAKVVEIKKSKFSFLKIAAIFIFLFTVAGGLFALLNNKETSIYSENEVFETKLSDGTNITLNKNSEISYNSKFNKKDRKVELKGEAYFSVEHDVNKPFIIETESGFIEVVGTEFYVNSSKNSLEVIVNSGIVAVYKNSDKSDSVHISKNQKTVISDIISTIEVKENEDNNYISWKTKKLNFDNSTFSEVVETLEKTYDVDIEVKNPDLLNCEISGKFDNQSIESVLTVIQSILDFQYKITENKVIIEGSGC